MGTSSAGLMGTTPSIVPLYCARRRITYPPLGPISVREFSSISIFYRNCAKTQKCLFFWRLCSTALKGLNFNKGLRHCSDYCDYEITIYSFYVTHANFRIIL